MVGRLQSWPQNSQRQVRFQHRHHNYNSSYGSAGRRLSDDSQMCPHRTGGEQPSGGVTNNAKPNAQGLVWRQEDAYMDG